MTSVASPSSAEQAVPVKQSLTPEERRSMVQASAATSYQRREFVSRLYMIGIGAALLVAFIPLAGIMWTVVGRALPYMTWTFLTTPPKEPTIFDQSAIGGVSNFITASLLGIAMAVGMALPLGIMCSIALYESKGKIMRGLRMVLEVMVGMPSILFGIFIFLAVVRQMGNTFSLFAGSCALAVLMIPLIAVASEDALRGVPQILTEAGLALGAKRSRILFRIVLPYARPRMLTGVLLALSRAVGETAPVYWVIGAAAAVNWNPFAEATTLPAGMFVDIQSIYASVRNEVWGMALILMGAVLVINLTSRAILARTNREQQ